MTTKKYKSTRWTIGQKVPYLALAETFECIENESSRTKSIEILSNFYKSIVDTTPDDLLACVYLCINQLAPAYENIVLGIGKTILIKATSKVTGISVEKIKSDLCDKGDLGLVAESNQNWLDQEGPTVQLVFNSLKEISVMSGKSVIARKIDKIVDIFSKCSPIEVRYFIRCLTGKLRIGLADQSILQALALVFVDDPKRIKQATSLLKTTFNKCPNYDELIPFLLRDGMDKLSNFCSITPGIPIKLMSAYPTKGIKEILDRFDDIEFVSEYKYDGERAQIHVLNSNDIKIFSRNQENNTNKYPDVIERMYKAMKSSVKSCIIDSEIVAYDIENGRILPFQIQSTRKRKDVNLLNINVQVCIYAFDLLYLNGESLINVLLKKRRNILNKYFQHIEGEFHFVNSLISNDTDDIADFLEEAIKHDCEGLMVKNLNSLYEIGKRSHNWLKLKKDYLEGIGDTLDLVVIGGYYGVGKRTGKYGGFLLACYDDENDEYQSICKIGTGFSDIDLTTLSIFLKNKVVESPPSKYKYDLKRQPDDWFKPVRVWEIKAADLTLSPIYKAAIGKVNLEKGISLRFPRFIRVRSDKKPKEATTSNEIVEMYHLQTQLL